MPPPERSQPADYHFHVYDYANAQAWALSQAQPERAGLQFYSMMADLQGLLAYGRDQGVPNIALTNVGNGVDSDGTQRTIQALSFGGPRDLSHTPSALITGGIHAREWIAPEMAYLLAEYLIKNYSNAAPNTLTQYQRDIRSLVDNRQIHIIPLLNPNGNNYTVFSPNDGARLWRKNRRNLPLAGMDWVVALNHMPFTNVQLMQSVSKNTVVQYKIPMYVGNPPVPPGAATKIQTFALIVPPTSFLQRVGVDVNRNFPTAAWGYYTEISNFNPDVKSDDYFGTNAASESETGAVAAYIRNIQNLGASIDYHSYGQVILYPSETWNNQQVTTQYQNLGLLMEGLTGYRLSTPSAVMGYDGVGSLMDFASSFPGVSSFTIEMDPALGAGDGGFQLPENQIRWCSRRISAPRSR